jgi:enamine deaminase RidA (YjgF/YER057c/UK114 family)
MKLFIHVCALGVAALSTSAAAQTRTNQTVVMAEHPGAREFQQRYGFSDAVTAGDLIFLSGIVVGARKGDNDIAGAYDRAYQDIGDVLKRAGASFDDIVELTSYHTDVTAQFEIMSGVHKKYVKAPYPAWTAIDVDRLIPDEGFTEIRIVARKPAAPKN